VSHGRHSRRLLFQSPRLSRSLAPSWRTIIRTFVRDLELHLVGNPEVSARMTAEELAHALGAVRSGRQWKCRCVAHEDRNPSMIIFEGREALQVRCMAGCEPRDIIAVLRSRGLWHGSDEQEQPEIKKPEKSLQTEQREHRTRILARGIFDAAEPISGTVAERYFDSRDLVTVARMIDDIRFHPRCPRSSGDDYREQPAAVIAMRSIVTNAVTGIQRIFLTRQGRKDGAMMLGAAGGAAIKLQHLQNHALHVCEGLETGLALLCMDRGPVWALGSTSGMQTFPVIANVRDLIIWADNDEPGLRAAAICKQRWEEGGNKTVNVYHSREHGWDQADVWSARCGRI
jgi:putative DNA primase/helicase